MSFNRTLALNQVVQKYNSPITAGAAAGAPYSPNPNPTFPSYFNQTSNNVSGPNYWAPNDTGTNFDYRWLHEHITDNPCVRNGVFAAVGISGLYTSASRMAAAQSAASGTAVSTFSKLGSVFVGAVIAGVSDYVSFKTTSCAAEGLTNLLDEHVFGGTRVPTRRNQPARLLDTIAHRHLGWGSFPKSCAMVVGAVVAVAAAAAVTVMSAGTMGPLAIAAFAGLAAGVGGGLAG